MSIYKVIESNQVYNQPINEDKNVNGTEEELVTFYCGEYDRESRPLSPKIISIFGLNDGYERIGNPSDPFAGNMYLGPNAEYKLYNLYTTEAEALEQNGEIIKIDVTRDYKIKNKQTIRTAEEKRAVNK